MERKINIYFALFLINIFVISVHSCVKRQFDHDSFVCVCNQTICDSFPTIIYPADGSYIVLTSSRDEFRYRFLVGTIDSPNTNYTAFARIFVNSSDKAQTMLGFGGAFTDSTGINVDKLSLPLQDTFMRQYFGAEGLEYNIGRIPIGGSDFSTYPYSYDDVEGDVELKFFNLTEEDHFYKIPLIKKAQSLSNREIHLFATPWSPPSWMKTNGMFNGSGSLIPEYQQPWANYIVKFLDAYVQEGINLWGLTVQNEPSAGTTDYRWNCCHFTAEYERDFVRDYLGPTLTAAGYRFLKLMIGDDARVFYPQFIEKVLNDTECAAYVDGIAIHWYTDFSTSPNIITEIHDLFPDYFILYTEACAGYLPQLEDHVDLGSWERGESYANDIIEDINNWSAGWTDWNMALDMQGGPNWVENFVDSPIIINTENDEFYKQPMFYVMGHFSKLVVEGSIRLVTSVEVIDGSGAASKIDATSFLAPDGYTISVVLNKNEDEKTVVIENLSGNLIILDLPPKSISTFLYKE